MLGSTGGVVSALGPASVDELHTENTVIADAPYAPRFAWCHTRSYTSVRHGTLRIFNNSKLPADAIIFHSVSCCPARFACYT